MQPPAATTTGCALHGFCKEPAPIDKTLLRAIFLNYRIKTIWRSYMNIEIPIDLDIVHPVLFFLALCLTHYEEGVYKGLVENV